MFTLKAKLIVLKNITKDSQLVLYEGESPFDNPRINSYKSKLRSWRKSVKKIARASYKRPFSYKILINLKTYKFLELFLFKILSRLLKTEKFCVNLECDAS